MKNLILLSVAVGMSWAMIKMLIQIIKKTWIWYKHRKIAKRAREIMKDKEIFTQPSIEYIIFQDAERVREGFIPRSKVNFT